MQAQTQRDPGMAFADAAVQRLPPQLPLQQAGETCPLPPIHPSCTHLVFPQVDLGARLLDNLAVHLHLSLKHQFICTAARCQPCSRNRLQRKPRR
jgi:hypothetical protein